MIESPLKNLPFLSKVYRFIVAYSGGLDSQVLLHAVAASRGEFKGIGVVAVHVNHGLSEKAEQWSQHCAAHCAALGVPFTNINVDAKPRPGESPEATAREVRYQAFRDFMQAGDCLLTAHHQDDQAETLLIQLLRGAGPRGLAAMPGYAEFANGWQARPLLNQRREGLLEYAQQAGLSWIDDESNSDTRFDRNFLRHEIMPRLKSRFPAAASTLSRSANLCAEASEIMASAAVADLAQVQCDGGLFSVSALYALGEIRARNLLHHWCRDHGLSTPSAAQLQCVWEEVIGAAADSDPVVSWTGGEARRYRDTLFLGRPLSAHDASQRLPWDWQQSLCIPGIGELYSEKVIGQGISPAVLDGHRSEIRFRQGGEQLRPAGRSGHHALKKLFQEEGVPPWLRERIPLIYADGQLLAVAGYWVAHEVAVRANEPGISLRWSAQAPALL